ncbi:MAG: GntR family transcriptional regulator [Negativicutes bacterium]|jgi:DNA-binding GntR family transcriptional regulator
MKNIIQTEKLPQENVREYIYRVIRDNILNLTLPPGASISEPAVANILHVSRTPVREAFIRLSEDKLLCIQPQRGTTVTLLDIELINESVFMRATLETEILRSACADFPAAALMELEINLFTQNSLVTNQFDPLRFHQLDNDFHALIFSGCAHNYSWEFLNRFNSHHRRLRMFEMNNEMYLLLIVKQHQQIFDAIKNKDASAIGEIVRNHLLNFLPNLDLLRKKQPEYFL